MVELIYLFFEIICILTNKSVENIVLESVF